MMEDEVMEGNLTMTIDGEKLNGDEVYRMFRIRRTISEMLTDRGYVIPAFEGKYITDMTELEFVEAFDGKSRAELLVQAQRENGDNIMVVFPSATRDKSNRIGVDAVKEVCQQFEAQAVTRGIIVLRSQLSAFALNELGKWCDVKTAITKIEHTVEHFLEDELMINVTRHKLVPQHRLLTPEEKRTLLQRYQLRPSQLPRIQKTDPLARYLGLKREDVVKIVRRSETAGMYVSYRIVTG